MTDRAAATAPAPAPLLNVSGVAKRYGQLQAVTDLSLTLNAGEIMGFVGPNGAGKTTTMRILAGLLRPDAGVGEVLGCDLAADRRAIARQVGYMPQRLALYSDLSVIDNLRFRAEVYGLDDPRGKVEAAIDAFGLGEHRKQRAGRLSGGWARRLQLAATLIHTPRLVLLDEPTAGLDAESRHDVWLRVAQLARDGAGVVINTHDLTEAEQCTRVALFAGGRILAEGSPDALSANLPLEAMLFEGAGAHALAETVCALDEVMAAYPEGRRLRVLSHPGAAPRLQAFAKTHDVSASSATVRFEDTAFVTVRRHASARAAAS